MRDLEPKPPIRRYEHARPGDLLHLDIKKLGRIRAAFAPGYRRPPRLRLRHRLGVCAGGVDDHSRIAFSALYPDEKQPSVLAFLADALAYYARFGIHFRAVLTDNGPGLPLPCLRPGLPRTGSETSFHPPLHTANQRQGGTVLSRLFSENGPELAPIRTPTSAARSFAPDCTSTTGIGRMVVSARRPPISRSALDRNNLLRLHN